MQTPPHGTSPRATESGQLFAGWIVGIFIIAAMLLYTVDAMRRSRASTQSTIYRELALNVAKAGFEQGLSFFRTHTSGCYLNSAEAPTGPDWVTPWPAYPDAAFLPQSTDTSFYNNISLSTSLAPGGSCAGGIIGDISMDEYVTYTGSTEMTGSALWGMYVLRRQNVQNWSPGPDTASANTDPDACHDVSAISTQTSLGSGTRWSIVSKGYLLRLPSPVTSAASSLLDSPTAFTDGNMLSAPLAYVNKQRFLLAQARVYGELSRVNFDLPTSAVLVPYKSSGYTLTVNTNGILNGSGYSAYCTDLPPGTVIANPSAGTVINSRNSAYQSTGIGTCFPGQTWGNLQKMALGLGTGGTISGYNCSSTACLPAFEGYNSQTGLSYSAQVDQPTFYFFPENVTLQGSDAIDTPVLSGVGLCVIEGNLTIPAGNDSSWAGVLYVSGSVTLDGPTNVTGIIISGTSITLGAAADLNKTTVAYDAGAISLVEGLLQYFTVDSSSIVATQF